MRGHIKIAVCNVTQMGEFWCFLILMSYVGKHLNWGRLAQVLLYLENPLLLTVQFIIILITV
jgi:hypothetical protein